MAWTNPRTWTDGELVTAAIMNQHVRDNLTELRNTTMRLIARTTSNVARTSTTLTNDATLILPMLANEVWRFEFCLLTFGNSDMQIGFSFTAGQMASQFVFIDGAGTVNHNVNVTTTSPVSPDTFYTPHTTLPTTLLPITGTFLNGGGSGNLTLQWASTSGSSVTLATNSTLWAAKLA